MTSVTSCVLKFWCFNISICRQQAKPLKGKAEELVKSFSAKVTEVTDELKAKNPELFSGDAQKLQVSKRTKHAVFAS